MFAFVKWGRRKECANTAVRPRVPAALTPSAFRAAARMENFIEKISG